MVPMKTIFLFLVLLGLNTQATSLVNNDLKTVDYVDPLQYIGRWYQIARVPLAFEPEVCACAQQTLGLNDNGTISVHNSCNQNTPSGKLLEIRGYAVNDDPKTNARFTVDFGLPRTGQYWIIGLAENYQWAVVSEPSRKSLYILSKTPSLDAEQYNLALSSAAVQVDTRGLKITQHDFCTYPN